MCDYISNSNAIFVSIDSFAFFINLLLHFSPPPPSFFFNRSVEDIDLFSAGLAEYPLPGAAVGPTFTCIIGIQMYNLKYGDRFWFEHKDQIASFTPGKLSLLLMMAFIVKYVNHTY